MLRTHMPAIPLGRPATYDDLLAVPAHLVAEIVDDQLWTSPRPAPRHATAYSHLVALLIPSLGFGRGGPGGWRLLAEPELHLTRDVVVPDLAGWRIERMPRLPSTAFFTVAPDWVCEILSPSTERLDRDKKLRVYQRAGVQYAWLIDPIARTLEVLGVTATTWTPLARHREAEVVHAAPFEAVALELGMLWSTWRERRGALKAAPGAQKVFRLADISPCSRKKTRTAAAETAPSLLALSENTSFSDGLQACLAFSVTGTA